MIRIAESIEGETIKLDAVRSFEDWEAYKDKVKLRSKDGTVVATVSITTLIACWIEKEEEQYKAAKSASN